MRTHNFPSRLKTFDELDQILNDPERLQLLHQVLFCAPQTPEEFLKQFMPMVFEKQLYCRFYVTRTSAAP